MRVHHEEHHILVGLQHVHHIHTGTAVDQHHELDVLLVLGERSLESRQSHDRHHGVLHVIVLEQRLEDLAGAYCVQIVVDDDQHPFADQHVVEVIGQVFDKHCGWMARGGVSAHGSMLILMEHSEVQHLGNIKTGEEAPRRSPAISLFASFFSHYTEVKKNQDARGLPKSARLSTAFVDGALL